MNDRRQQQGFALVVVMGYMMVLSIFSAVFLKSVVSSMRTEQQYSQQLKTRALADSAIHYAAAQLTVSGDYFGAAGVEMADGAFDVRVTRGAVDGAWVITAIGYLPDGPHQSYASHVRARIERRGASWVIRHWDTRAPVQREGA